MLTRRSALALPLCGLAAPTSASAPPALDLQGHRGARGLRPENTLPGFAHALSLGVTTLEFDLAVTRDGVLVLSHDTHLNPDITRGPDGRYLSGRGPAIARMLAPQLAAYDVGRIRPGTAYARQFPQQQPVDGARIPRLDELVELVRASGNEQVRLSMETKVHPLRPHDTVPADAFAARVVDAVRRHGIAQRASVQSFDWRTLDAIARQAPEIERVYLSSQQEGGFHTLRPNSPWTAGRDPAAHASPAHLVRAAGGRVWSAFHADLAPASVRQAHDLGLRVLAWTVNDTARMDTLIDMGVDGIVTDRPDLLRKVLRRRGMPLPPGGAPLRASSAPPAVPGPGAAPASRP